MNKPRLIMMVGIPGSGKSSWSKELSERYNAEIFASDKLRKELWGDENIQGNNKELFKELHKRIICALKESKNCIYDATNIYEKNRTQFLKDISGIDCEKICVIALTDFDICVARNEQRDRRVPYEVIKKMYLNIDIPQYREGWDKIIIKRTRDDLKDYDIFKFIYHLETINHDNPHHLLTIGAHIQAVVKHIMDEYQLTFAGDIDRLERLLRAALHHDIGKEFTKSFINNKGEETEVAHYYNHEKVSAYMYIMYEKENELENTKRILYIADLIGLHMRMHCICGDKEKSYQKIKNIVGKKEFEDLCILNEADIICG